MSGDVVGIALFLLGEVGRHRCICSISWLVKRWKFENLVAVRVCDDEGKQPLLAPLHTAGPFVFHTEGSRCYNYPEKSRGKKGSKDLGVYRQLYMKVFRDEVSLSFLPVDCAVVRHYPEVGFWFMSVDTVHSMPRSNPFFFLPCVFVPLASASPF